MSLVNPFLSIWLRQVLGEDSFFQLGLVLSFPMFIGVFGILGLTNITDKFGHYRETIIGINIIGMLQYLILTLISHPFQYLIVVGLGALIAPAYYTIILALATNICESDVKGKVTNYMTLYASAGWFLGSLFAGHGYNLLGMEPMLFFAAVLIFLAGILIIFSPESEHIDSLLATKELKSEESLISGENPTPEIQSPEKNSSFWDIISRRQIIFLLSSIIVLDFSAGAYFMLAPVYFNERASLSYEFIGYGNAIATLLAVIILWRLGPFSDQIGRRDVYLFGLLIYPIFFIILSIFHSLEIAFLLWCLPLYVFLRPTTNTMISDLTLDYERSRGMSTVMVSSSLAITIGTLLGGWAADSFDLGMDLWTIFPAFFSWIAVGIGYYFVKETKSFSKPDPIITTVDGVKC